jgi:hypothetical protein
MLENTWRRIECRLIILCATIGGHVEVMQRSAVLILQAVKHFELDFHIPWVVLFVASGFKIVGCGNHGNNLEALYT